MNTLVWSIHNFYDLKWFKIPGKVKNTELKSFSFLHSIEEETNSLEIVCHVNVTYYYYYLA